MKNTQDRVNEVESSPKNKIKFKSVKQVIIEALITRTIASGIRNNL